MSDVQRMKEEAERQRRIREQQEAEIAKQQKRATEEARQAAEAKDVTPKHAEGYDIQRKTGKVYKGPRVTGESKIGETKEPELTPIYHVGGSEPKFKKTTEKLQQISDDFFSKSGLPDEPIVTAYTVGRPGGRLGPGPYRIKSTEEAINRLGYAATQMVIGGAAELALPFSWSETAPISREADRGFRVLGGLLIPSPVDVLAGQVIAKLAKSKAWLKLTGKYGEVDISELEMAAAREIEKLKGKGQPYSVAEIRSGIKKVYNNLEDVARFYKDHPELATPERTSTGSAQVPKVVQEFEDYLNDLGWDMDEYLKFMKERAPELPVGALVNILAGITDRGEPIESTIIDLSNYTDRADRYKFTPAEKAKLADAADALLDQPVKAEEEQRPLIDQPVKPTQREEPMQTPQQDTPQKIVPELEEPEPIPTKEPTPTEKPPTLPPTIKQQEREYKQMGPLRFYMGANRGFRVVFTYPRGGKETVTVEASSYPEAMSVAQRARQPRRDAPVEVNLWAA